MTDCYKKMPNIYQVNPRAVIVPLQGFIVAAMVVLAENDDAYAPIKSVSQSDKNPTFKLTDWIGKVE